MGVGPAGVRLGTPSLLDDVVVGASSDSVVLDCVSSVGISDSVVLLILHRTQYREYKQNLSKGQEKKNLFYWRDRPLFSYLLIFFANETMVKSAVFWTKIGMKNCERSQQRKNHDF